MRCLSIALLTAAMLVPLATAPAAGGSPGRLLAEATATERSPEPAVAHCVLRGDKTASPTVALGATLPLTLTLQAACAPTQGVLVFTIGGI